jgi:hypothetical protein
MTQPNLLKLLNEVGVFCSQYDKLTTPLLTSASRAKIISSKLNDVRGLVLKLVPPASDSEIDSCISWGSGYFPRVPWIGFHVKGLSVTSALSVVICFSRDGKGIVCGLMVPAGRKSRYKTLVRTNLESFLNVTSSGRTRYNNQFINPKDFYFGKLNIQDVISHLEHSINFLVAQNTEQFLLGAE